MLNELRSNRIGHESGWCQEKHCLLNEAAPEINMIFYSYCWCPFPIDPPTDSDAAALFIIWSILAQKLQEECDRESANAMSFKSPDCRPDERENASTSRPQSVVDPSWEVTETHHPDVRALFRQFNNQFFWGKLVGVKVEWSKRLTSCAGVCSYGLRTELCTIRLSERLLKRSEKDIEKTLLHEMIHAFLFVTEKDMNRDGHGPNFKKHMDRINKTSEAKITIFHDFLDEVDNGREHVWRCDGPCTNKEPYYGFVKRKLNRAPSSQDSWWSKHQRTCGGTFTKVKEPDGYKAKKKGGKGKQTAGVESKAHIGSSLGKGNEPGGSSQQSKIPDKTGNKRKTVSTSTSSVDTAEDSPPKTPCFRL
ncbi:hypothetical protein BaRGS_00029265 [Batillaria attramentaria]|uniref:SprT-like domain-containing protein n=1 Tax=Batillaria attramentaria TaxID=370345 RepID=A0ABD0JWH8_9CAEN